ncbi:MAG: hypothetical protein AB7F76_08235 [Parvibaculaceae bacterium]|jgi:hypothetical protein
MEEDGELPPALRWAGYAWRIAVGVLTLVVLEVTFMRVESDERRIIVAVLGTMYVVMRLHYTVWQRDHERSRQTQYARFTYIVRMLQPYADLPSLPPPEKGTNIRFGIDIAFLTVTLLTCIFRILFPS